MTKQEILNAVSNLDLSEQKEVSKALTKSINEIETKAYNDKLKNDLCKFIDEGKVTYRNYSHLTKPYFYPLASLFFND